ncbi:hypothetical protein [Streptomyces abyssalis]|nr:hypothetical protein [Streptomyces abyssalis]
MSTTTAWHDRLDEAAPPEDTAVTAASSGLPYTRDAHRSASMPRSTGPYA